jgi:hypothetical protein
MIHTDAKQEISDPEDIAIIIIEIFILEYCGKKNISKKGQSARCVN